MPFDLLCQGEKINTSFNYLAINILLTIAFYYSKTLTSILLSIRLMNLSTLLLSFIS